MPILTYDSFDQAIEKINTMPHPLALYIFTSNKEAANKQSLCGFGGGCIDDLVIRLATSEMGFGGFGESGMALITEKPALILSPIIKVLWTKKHGWIFQCDTSHILKTE